MKRCIINMTPHPVIILSEENDELRKIPASGNLIRLKSKTINTGVEIDGVKTSKTQFSDPEGLPEFKEGVYYIVSQLVKSALPDRTDLLVPAEVVRDDNGNIIGCRSLGR